jgi:hypothetical protein
MVEGRVLFGSLVSSVAIVILAVILGLRYLTAAFLAVICGVLILSLTNWLNGLWK